jgi:hypothetical protein
VAISLPILAFFGITKYKDILGNDPIVCRLDLTLPTLSSKYDCVNGAMTIVARPDNGEVRYNGSVAAWFGMTSGWDLPPDWQVLLSLSDGSRVERTGPGGFGPNDPQNDKISHIQLTAPSTGKAILRSCYATCASHDTGEAAELITIAVAP